MALSNEDHKDVKKHLGKALANKVKTVTNDSRMKRHQSDMKSGKFVRLTPLRGAAAGDKERETGDRKATHFGPSKQHDGYGWKEGYKHKGLGSS